MSNMQIRIVFFDLGDTLVRVKPGLINDSIRQIETARGRTIKRKRDLEQARVQFQIACRDEWVSRQSESRLIQTVRQEREYWPVFFSGILRRLGVEDRRGELSRLLARRQADPQSFECFPDVLVTLEQLQTHFVLGIISNAFPSARKIMQSLKLAPRFEYLVFSNEVNCQKPEPEIYQYAIECAHVPVMHSVFVDDRPSFVEGAQAIDMPGVLLDRDGQYGKDWTGARIRRLPSLLQIIEPLPEVKHTMDNWSRMNRVRNKFTIWFSRTLSTNEPLQLAMADAQAN